MTREKAKTLLPVIQAFAEGKVIERKMPKSSSFDPESWIECSIPDWSENFDWRIKPQPREFWLVGSREVGYRCHQVSALGYAFGEEVIHVREVTEEI